MTDAELADAATSIDRPLSVIYQVTRRCNFDCDFCSETAQTKDPTLDQIAAIETNLAGVPRVFLSGGEPLIRRDFVEIVDIFKDHIIGVPTNATRGHLLAPKLVSKVSFINVGLEDRATPPTGYEATTTRSCAASWPSRRPACRCPSRPWCCAAC